MVRLHLVGFTTDLKNIIFATRKGAKSGGYVIAIDARLRRTLEEVARLEEEEIEAKKVGRTVASQPPAPPKSQLSPKEIQALLREGKSEEQVAKLAETDVSWIERFTAPIHAERAGVIAAVRAGRISKQRLGTSGVQVGAAIADNLEDKKVRLEPEELQDSWKAVRRSGRWVVTFAYVSRGQRKQARFAYYPERREVEALNAVAAQIGWRPVSTKQSRPRPKATSTRSPARRPSKTRSSRR